MQLLCSVSLGSISTPLHGGIVFCWQLEAVCCSRLSPLQVSHVWHHVPVENQSNIGVSQHTLAIISEVVLGLQVKENVRL